MDGGFPFGQIFSQQISLYFIGLKVFKSYRFRLNLVADEVVPKIDMPSTVLDWRLCQLYFDCWCIESVLVTCTIPLARSCTTEGLEMSWRGKHILLWPTTAPPNVACDFATQWFHESR